MRLIAALALSLAGCFGSTGEPESVVGCSLHARSVPIGPADGCRRVTAADARFRLAGDSDCGHPCIVIGPGDRYEVLTADESAEVHVELEPIDCSAQCD